MTALRSSGRRAFTLIEMLVVIGIIGILMALISPAVYNALWSARQTKIKVEVDSLSAAIEAFKGKYGAYPPANLAYSVSSHQPANASSQQLFAFVTQAFPSYTISPAGANAGATTLADQLLFDLQQAGVVPTSGNALFDPQRALVFWLSGFNPDPTQPFTFYAVDPNNSSQALPVTRTNVFFDFDKTRLIDVQHSTVGTPLAAALGVPCAVSSGVPNPFSPASGTINPTLQGEMIYQAPYGGAAYVYLDYLSYGYQANGAVVPSGTTFPTTPSTVYPWTFPLQSSNANSLEPATASTPTVPFKNDGSNAGIVVPYFADTNNNGQVDAGESYAKPNSYQIISAGQDGDFGYATDPSAATFWARMYPLGVGYDPKGGDDDNVTNFNEKNNLASAKP